MPRANPRARRSHTRTPHLRSFPYPHFHSAPQLSPMPVDLKARLEALRSRAARYGSAGSAAPGSPSSAPEADSTLDGGPDAAPAPDIAPSLGTPASPDSAIASSSPVPNATPLPATPDPVATTSTPATSPAPTARATPSIEERFARLTPQRSISTPTRHTPAPAPANPPDEEEAFADPPDEEEASFAALVSGIPAPPGVDAAEVQRLVEDATSLLATTEKRQDKGEEEDVKKEGEDVEQGLDEEVDDYIARVLEGLRVEGDKKVGIGEGGDEGEGKGGDEEREDDGEDGDENPSLLDIDLPSAPATPLARITAAENTDAPLPDASEDALAARWAALGGSTAKSKPALPAGKPGLTDEEIESWCIICCADASVRCLGCGGDLYCAGCWNEGHRGPDVGLEERRHKAVEYIPGGAKGRGRREATPA
ncbi:hypothetical protein EJ06DRAFT_426665 [Trichodelitschia bisporula]|uniref:Uncharacterized protein n=1 Tax=Trichodelitschia bisporula TaxID=703511 RepID=A0A6G1HWD5_9PEZI|nr:hypothetical protein EJ06DRAFT_426665 [Trichodelitschia bisporula]